MTKTVRLSRTGASLAGLFLALSAGSGFAQTADMEAIAEAARAEGALTIYTATTESTVARLVNAFRAEHPGITVNILRLPSGALNTRYGTEVDSGVFEADIFNTATTDLFTRHPDWWQQLDDIGLPSIADWPEGARTDTYVFTSFGEHGIAYNTNNVSNPPQSWEDVLSPEYKGNCLIIDPNTSPTFISFYNLLQRSYGEDFLPRLREQNCKLASAGQPAAQEVAAGGALIAFPVTPSQVTEVEKMGAPVRRVVVSENSPANAHGIVQYYALPKRSRNPEAAKLYLNWYLSRTGQAEECLSLSASPLPDLEGCEAVSPKFEPARSDLTAEERDEVMRILTQ